MMNTKTTLLLVAGLMIFHISVRSESFPDLVAESESVRVWGRKYYQEVSLTGKTILAYDPGPRKEHIIGITCNSFLLSGSSSVVFGATSQYGTSVPLSVNTTGTPDVVVKEYGVTEGNGGGTYGGKGFNYFGTAKAPYGSAIDFEVHPGSMGSAGESFRMWYGGAWITFEGYPGGRTGGCIAIIGNNVTIEGWINVNGESGYGAYCATRYPGYSGSGGGILIAAKRLTIADTARITANGGEYALTEHCTEWEKPYHERQEVIGKRDGGGGRIKIFYEQGTISPDAVIEAEGWEDGTVHIQQVRSIDQLLNPGDLNGDGKIDQEDLFLFQQGWHKTATPVPTPEETPTPTATPEP